MTKYNHPSAVLEREKAATRSRMAAFRRVPYISLTETSQWPFTTMISR